MIDFLKILPFLGIAIVGGGVIFLLNNKEQVYVELKKWWKNRNEKQTN